MIVRSINKAYLNSGLAQTRCFPNSPYLNFSLDREVLKYFSSFRRRTNASIHCFHFPWNMYRARFMSYLPKFSWCFPTAHLLFCTLVTKNNFDKVETITARPRLHFTNSHMHTPKTEFNTII